MGIVRSKTSATKSFISCFLKAVLCINNKCLYLTKCGGTISEVGLFRKKYKKLLQLDLFPGIFLLKWVVECEKVVELWRGFKIF